MSTLSTLVDQVSMLATSIGNALQLRGFKSGGTVGQVPTKLNSTDFNWSWQTPVGGGGGGTYASLTDAATVNLPAVNTPLSSALTGKAPVSTTVTLTGVQTLENKTLATLTVTGDAAIGNTITDLVGFYGVAGTAQGAIIADPTGGAVQDAEARTAINAIILRLETLGLIAT